MNQKLWSWARVLSIPGAGHDIGKSPPPLGDPASYLVEMNSFITTHVLGKSTHFPDPYPNSNPNSNSNPNPNPHRNLTLTPTLTATKPSPDLDYLLAKAYFECPGPSTPSSPVSSPSPSYREILSGLPRIKEAFPLPYCAQSEPHPMLLNMFI